MTPSWTWHGAITARPGRGPGVGIDNWLQWEKVTSHSKMRAPAASIKIWPLQRDRNSVFQITLISSFFHPARKRNGGRGTGGDRGGGLWIALATKRIGLSYRENKIPSGNLAVNGLSVISCRICVRRGAISRPWSRKGAQRVSVIKPWLSRMSRGVLKDLLCEPAWVYFTHISLSAIVNIATWFCKLLYTTTNCVSLTFKKIAHNC